MKNLALLAIILLPFLLSCNKKSKVTDSSNQIEEIIEMKTDLTDNSAQDIKANQKDVTLEMLCSTIRIESDTLYFNYKVINNSSRNLFFYHLQLLSYSLELTIDPQYNFPKCNVIITDRNESIPSLIGRTGGQKKYEPAEYSLNSFVMIESNNSQLFKRGFYIGDLVLNPGEYKFRLQYYSPYNQYYLTRFKKKKEQTVSLKNYDLFEGVLESNRCSFIIKENE